MSTDEDFRHLVYTSVADCASSLAHIHDPERLRRVVEMMDAVGDCGKTRRVVIARRLRKLERATR